MGGPVARLLGFYMEFELIETGKIINTHALRGEVKIDPWADSAEAFCGFTRLFIDGAEHKVEHMRAQKGFVIAKLTGIDSIEAAESVKNKTVYVPRGDIELEDGGYLIGDLVGCAAFSEDGGELGKITDIITLPRGEVLEIHGAREILVPLNGEFVTDVDLEGKRVTLRLIEGM